MEIRIKGSDRVRDIPPRAAEHLIKHGLAQRAEEVKALVGDFDIVEPVKTKRTYRRKDMQAE